MSHRLQPGEFQMNHSNLVNRTKKLNTLALYCAFLPNRNEVNGICGSVYVLQTGRSGRRNLLSEVSMEQELRDLNRKARAEEERLLTHLKMQAVGLTVLAAIIVATSALIYVAVGIAGVLLYEAFNRGITAVTNQEEAQLEISTAFSD